MLGSALSSKEKISDQRFANARLGRAEVDDSERRGASRETKMLRASDALSTKQPPTNDQPDGRSCVAIITQTGLSMGSNMVIKVASNALTSRMAREYSR
jgi:hypothetical protein